MIRMKPFTLSLVVAGALVMAFNGTSHAHQGHQRINSVPTTAFCNCALGIAPLCTPGGVLIFLGPNQVFEMTDVTVASRDFSITALNDDSSTMGVYVTPANGTTVTQAFKTPIIFKTNVNVVCSSTSSPVSSNAFVTVNGVLVTQ